MGTVGIGPKGLIRSRLKAPYVHTLLSHWTAAERLMSSISTSVSISPYNLKFIDRYGIIERNICI